MDFKDNKFSQIELGIILQRAIDLIDEVPADEGNKKLKKAFVGIIPQLEKSVNLYNKLYEQSPEYTQYFYNVSEGVVDFVMKSNLIDKAMILQYLNAIEIDENAVNGIIKKVLKTKLEK